MGWSGECPSRRSERAVSSLHLLMYTCVHSFMYIKRHYMDPLHPHMYVHTHLMPIIHCCRKIDVSGENSSSFTDVCAYLSRGSFPWGTLWKFTFSISTERYVLVPAWQDAARWLCNPPPAPSPLYHSEMHLLLQDSVHAWNTARAAFGQWCTPLKSVCSLITAAWINKAQLIISLSLYIISRQ